MKYTKTMKLSILEGALYTLAFNATQGFVFSTLALYFQLKPVTLSILAALPATSQLFQFFAPTLYRFQGSRKKLITTTAYIGRSAFLILLFALVFDIKSELFVAIPMVVFNFVNSFTGALWIASMRSIVSEDIRGKYFGFRNTIASVAGTLSFLLNSLILKFVPQRAGLIIIYAISSSFFLLTAYLLAKHDIPESSVKDYSILLPLESIKNVEFRKMLIFAFFWNFAIQFAGPFFSYFEVAYLKIDYAILGILSVVNSILASLFYLFFGKISTYFGNKNTLRFGLGIVLAIPLLYSLMTPRNYLYLLIIDIIVAAFGWTAINLSYFNLLLQIAREPAEFYVSTHALVAGIASLIASYLGGLTAGALKDIRFVFDSLEISGYNILFFMALILRIAVYILFIKLDFGNYTRKMTFREMGYRLLTRNFNERGI